MARTKNDFIAVCVEVRILWVLIFRIQRQITKLPNLTPCWETFEGENFRRSVGREHFAEKIFAEC